MTLREKILAISRWYKVRRMQYPADPVQGQWYLYLNQSTTWSHNEIKELHQKHYPDVEFDDYNQQSTTIEDKKYVLGEKLMQVDHFSDIWVCVGRYGYNEHINLGSVDLILREFPKLWKELIAAAKDRVDRLNDIEAALEQTGEGGSSCASCVTGRAPEDDYLCTECRGREGVEN